MRDSIYNDTLIRADYVFEYAKDTIGLFNSSDSILMESKNDQKFDLDASAVISVGSAILGKAFSIFFNLRLMTVFYLTMNNVYVLKI